MGKSRRVDSMLRWPELFYHARNAYVEELSLCYRTVQLGLFEAMQRFLAVDGKVQAGTAFDRITIRDSKIDAPPFLWGGGVLKGR